MSRNLLEYGANYLQSGLETWASEAVTYRRGSLEFSVLAIVGQLMTEAQDVTGFIVQSYTKDFTIRQSGLRKFLFEEHQPRRNDEILQVVNGEIHRFLVNADSTQTSHYRDSDGYGVAYRVHTVRDEVIT